MMMAPPKPRQVTHLNQLRQMLILLRSAQKLGETEPQGNEAEISASFLEVSRLYQAQRSRCGYPPVESSAILRMKGSRWQNESRR